MKYEEDLIMAIYKSSKKKNPSYVLDVVQSMLEELIADIPDKAMWEPDIKVVKQQLRDKWL